MEFAAIRTREQAAQACLDILDTTFFKALCEPARIRVLRELVLKGRADVGSLASGLPQDRSVITRHLQVMERAGLVRSATEGRYTFYEIDAAAILRRLDDMTTLIRRLSPLCCPTKS